MNDIEKIQKIKELCEAYLAEHPLYTNPQDEAMGSIMPYDALYDSPESIATYMVRLAGDHALQPQHKLSNIANFMSNNKAKHTMCNNSFGEILWHSIVCVLTGKFEGIGKSCHSLFASKIDELLPKPKESPRFSLEFEHNPKIGA
jgi:hypothetical protein